MNPHWQTEDGSIRLYCADCLDVLPTLSGVDAVVTDPPYGIGYCHGLRKGGVKLGTDGMSIMGDDKPFDPLPLLRWPCVIWGAEHFKSRLPNGGRWLTWWKRRDNITRDQADTESAWCSVDGVARLIRVVWDGCDTEDERRTKRVHSNQKPVRVMEWCLGFVDGRIVLDPFMGSGTTGVACVRLGRRFIGIEKEPKYFEIAKNRITEELNKMRLFEPPPKIVQRTLCEVAK